MDKIKRAGFLEKINKIDNPLTILTGKRMKTQFTNIKDEIGYNRLYRL